MAFSLAEPLPTTLPNHYTYAGRGGAGNMYKPSASTPSVLHKSTTTTSTASSTASTSSAKFYAGRGGAGNVRPLADAAPFSFADELSAQTTREQAQARARCHVGRGGAGNWTSGGEGGMERMWSGSSGGSARSGLLGRISGVFERR